MPFLREGHGPACWPCVLPRPLPSRAGGRLFTAKATGQAAGGARGWKFERPLRSRGSVTPAKTDVARRGDAAMSELAGTSAIEAFVIPPPARPVSLGDNVRCLLDLEGPARRAARATSDVEALKAEPAVLVRDPTGRTAWAKTVTSESQSHRQK